MQHENIKAAFSFTNNWKIALDKNINNKKKTIVSLKN